MIDITHRMRFFVEQLGVDAVIDHESSSRWPWLAMSCVDS